MRELERAQARDRVRARESRDSAARLHIEGIKGMRMPKTSMHGFSIPYLQAQGAARCARVQTRRDGCRSRTLLLA